MIKLANLTGRGNQRAIPVRSEYPNTPERPETLDAQLEAVTQGTRPAILMLGHVEPKSPATTQTVVARQPDGTEVQASAVSPENSQQQAGAMQRQYPKAQIEQGGPELAAQVLEERTSPPPTERRRPATGEGSRHRYQRHGKSGAAAHGHHWRRQDCR